MKFTIKKNTILEALKYVNNIIDSNNINPILSAVNLICENKQLILIATNGENSYKQTIMDIKSEKDGNILIKARILYNVISKLDNNEILLNQLDDAILQIKTSNFSCEINLIEKFSFPIINFDHSNWNKFILKQKDISMINSKITPFVSNIFENSYNILNGVFFNPINEKEIETIATDGFKLNYYSFNYEGKVNSFTIPVQVIKICDEILQTKKSDELTFYTNDRNIVADFKDTIILFSLFSGKYPNVTKSLLEEQKHNFTVKTSDLANALARGSIFVTTEKKPIVTLKINNDEFEIKFNNMEIGNSYETIKIVNQNIKDFSFKLNQKFLSDLISVVSEQEITFNFNGENKPIILTSSNKNLVSLILPIKSL